MDFLALTLPSGQQIQAPSEIEELTRNAGPFGENIIRTSIEILFIGAILLALFFLIWGGIQWMTSGGDKEKLQKARTILTYVVIGLVVVFMSFFVIQLIGGFFQIPLLGS